MKKILYLGVLIALFFGTVGFTATPSLAAAQHYTVLVGSDDPSMEVSIGSFFPQTVRIHVGDSVTWNANSHEIHTVTFLAGGSLQPLIIPAPVGMASPLQLNPLAAFPTPTNLRYDGSTYLNSGIMSTDPGFISSFNLTFTKIGVYDYICYIHGQMMTGTIQVVGASTAVPTPAQVQAQAQTELKAAWSNVPAVLAKADAQIVPPVRNANGTFTHTIIMGYDSGNIMVMGFFPKSTTVLPGDTIIWKLSSTDMEAPHTVTFYNGAPDQSFVIIAQGQNGPVALINPAVLFPSQAVLQGKPLNNTDFFNSGILAPGQQTTFTLKVGKVSGTLNYECILHDTSGMTGSLLVPSLSR